MWEKETIVRLFRDGNQFCALVGLDLMEGTSGFGPTPGAALRALAGELDDAASQAEQAA